MPFPLAVRRLRRASDTVCSDAATARRGPTHVFMLRFDEALCFRARIYRMAPALQLRIKIFNHFKDAFCMLWECQAYQIMVQLHFLDDDDGDATLASPPRRGTRCRPRNRCCRSWRNSIAGSSCVGMNVFSHSGSFPFPWAT